MSVQSRNAPQLSPGNFVQPAPPGGGSLQQVISSSPMGFVSQSTSSVLFHRYPPRDPFALSAPPSTTVSTLPGSGGLFLSASVNSHTGFVPARIGASGKTDAPAMKPPKPPEKPLMPYMRYSRRMWEKVRTSNPDSKLWDIGKIIGQMWRELPESSRQVYVDEYELEKQEYDKALKAYHNSPSYQAYLLSKNRASRGGEKPGGGVAESGVYIQPVEEDDGDVGQFSIKQLAASRFHRNHRLMKEIFGETQVPDARNVITAQRLGVLKKQVNSLTLHQNKLEEELKQLEAKFESKKRKMDESSDQFSLTLKKICTHKMEPFEELVERSRTHLLNAYEQYKIHEEKQREALLNELSRSQAAENNSDQAPPSSSTVDEKPNGNAETDSDHNQQREETTEVPTDDNVPDATEPPESDVAQKDEPSPAKAPAVRRKQYDSGSKAKKKSKKAAKGEDTSESAPEKADAVEDDRVRDGNVGQENEDSGDASAGKEGENISEKAVDGEKDLNNETAASSLPQDDTSENSQEA